MPGVTSHPASAMDVRVHQKHPQIEHDCALYDVIHPAYVTSPNDSQLYCNSTWDTVACWPTSPAGHMATINCPREYLGFPLESGNATRQCLDNGTWHRQADYESCEFLIPDKHHTELMHNFTIRVLYWIGFSTSTLACFIALFIFLYLRSLRCLRNTIHCHLITTFMLRNLFWMGMNSLLPRLNGRDAGIIQQWTCRVIVAIFNYLQVTNFSWMLVEGLYLHTAIVWTFSVDKMRFWHYAIIGWCAPALVTLAWVIVKIYYENVQCWLPQKETYYDYVYIGPILAVLLANIIFLGSIVWVLITKLRASNSLQAKQYRRAARSTLIMLPLLGVTYVIFLSSPQDERVTRLVFVYFNVVLQSLQGLAVAVFYCFLNTEVRHTVRQRLTRWREGRTVATRYSRGGSIANATYEQVRVRASSLAHTDAPTTLTTSCNGQQPQQQQQPQQLKNNNKNGFTSPPHTELQTLALEDNHTSERLQDEEL